MILVYDPNLLDDKDLVDQVYKLVSLPFNKVRHRLEILDLFNKIYNSDLCRVCLKDREYAYIKLTKFYKDAENKVQDKTR